MVTVYCSIFYSPKSRSLKTEKKSVPGLLPSTQLLGLNKERMLIFLMGAAGKVWKLPEGQTDV